MLHIELSSFNLKNQPIHFMTPGIQFLINCCKTNPTASAIEQIRVYITQLKNKQLSEVITLAHTHGVFPLIYHAIRAHVPDLIPEETHAELKQHNMTIVMQNMRMTAELIRIMRLLEENGIEALAFKGPTLAQLAYKDIALRQYGDLDILVDEDNAFIAAKIMSDNGHNAILPLKILQNRTCLKVAKDFSLLSEQGGVHTELHWRLFEQKYNILLFEDSIGNSQDVLINGNSIKTLSAEVLLVYLCLHGSKHAWERIEWICDVDRLLRSSTIDWNQLTTIANKSHSIRSFYLGLNLSNSLFQTPLPDILIERMTKNDIAELKAITLININKNKKCLTLYTLYSEK